MGIIRLETGLRTTALELVRAKGTFIVTYYLHDMNKNGEIFFLKDKDYESSLNIKDGRVIYERNSHKASLRFDDIINNQLAVLVIFAEWDVTIIKLSFGLIPQHKDVIRQKEVATEFTLPPSKLLRKILKQNLSEINEYQDQHEFNNKVHSCLASINDKICEMKSMNGFWNISYQGNKIVNKIAKRETDIQSLMHAILSDQFLMANIEVIPEYTTAIGNVDFVLQAYVAGMGITKVMIEIKNAHSQNILDGLTKQLPAYMLSKNISYGCYVILWYGRYKGEKNEITYDEFQEKFLVEILMSEYMNYKDNIKIFFVNLTPTVSASKI